MRIHIFTKHVLLMLTVFSLLFLASMFIFITRFEDKYVDENIAAVKTAIETSAEDVRAGDVLSETSLSDLSGETSIVRYDGGTITDMLGPDVLSEEKIIDFVTGIYDNDDKITDGNLTYVVIESEGNTHVRYLYEYSVGDYLIVLTDIQSLRHVDRVIADLGLSQTVFFLVTILIVSMLISLHFTKPIKTLAKQARSIADFDFSPQPGIRRRDEFADLSAALDDMRLHLKEAFFEMNRANEKLASDIAEEKQTEAKKKELIMTINHEMKTPLSVIRGMVEGMIDNIGRYKDKDKYLNEVLKQVDQIEAITADLTYSLKLEDKASKKKHCTVALLKERMQPMKALAQMRGVTLEVSLEDAEIRMNGELLVIFAHNLIKNAIRYTDDDHVKVIGEKQANDYILTIENKGHLNKSPEELFKKPDHKPGDSPRVDEGWGYGLYIVGQIALLHDIKITIENQGDTVNATAKILLKKDDLS